jgi:predicted nucleic acid-binding protein
MTRTFVADASVAIAWVHPGQATAATIAMLDALADGGSLEVPAELATDHQMSVNDAAYLELALRRRLVLACKDGPLRTAAGKAGVDVW